MLLTQLGVMQTQHRARISMANATPAAQHIVGQYYQFLRMGHAGYLRVLHGCATVAAHLADGIAATGAFTILSVRTPPPASPTKTYAADSRADNHTAHSFMLVCVHCFKLLCVHQNFTIAWEH